MVRAVLQTPPPDAPNSAARPLFHGHDPRPRAAESACPGRIGARQGHDPRRIGRTPPTGSNSLPAETFRATPRSLASPPRNPPAGQRPGPAEMAQVQENDLGRRRVTNGYP